MPTVDSSRRKGNFAESTVASWLARQCLVRHVSQGTDIGIDLYCESLLGDSPYKHFWVQVKSLPEGDFDYGGSARCRFERKHLDYWLRQPVPVYAFLVPVVGIPPEPPEFIYGVRLTDILVREGLPSSKTITYETSEGISADSIESDLSGFIRNIVPVDTASLSLPRGVIAPIDEPDPDALESFPKDLALIHIDSVLSTIRFATEMSLAELVEALDKQPGLRERRRSVEKIALALEDNLNVIGLTALANSRFMDGHYEDAKRYFKAAKQKIKQTVEDPQEQASQLKEIDAALARIP